MPNYRPVISRDDLQQLEHYLYALYRYTDTPDFQKDTNSQKQAKILHEMGFIMMAIDIFKQTFSGTGNDIPVVGWEIKNPDEKYGFLKIWHFSSAAAAGKILNINKSHIGAACRGARKTAGGWNFKFKSEYEDVDADELYNFDPNSPRFEIINISNDEKRTTTSDGNV